MIRCHASMPLIDLITCPIASLTRCTNILYRRFFQVSKIFMRNLQSIFSNDVCVDRLENQLRMLGDVICVELPKVKKVNSRTICDAIAQHGNKNILSEVICYFDCISCTIPITSSISESFTTLRRLFTYLRSSMSEKRLNQRFL